MRASPAAALIQEYRRSHSGIGLGDHLIVASALTEGLELALLNTATTPCFPASRALSDPAWRDQFTR